MENKTNAMEFILTGLTTLPKLKGPLFVIFSLVYAVTVFGNLLIILLIWVHPRLHTPMYFLLRNLSCLDIGFSSTVIPKMLQGFIARNNTISFPACLTQMYFFISFAGIESALLSLMSYDRYLAICHPLHYTSIMSHRVCIKLTTACWLIGLLNSLLHTILVSRLSFCKSNIITHFFCDVQPLLMLSCTDISVNMVVIFSSSAIFVLLCSMIPIISYVQIIRAILKIGSSAGRQQAFSTCTSHLTVFTLFYASLTFVYMRPASSYSLSNYNVVALAYTTITPMLNPIVYSLRNRDVKGAMKKFLGREHF